MFAGFPDKGLQPLGYTLGYFGRGSIRSRPGGLSRGPRCWWPRRSLGGFGFCGAAGILGGFRFSGTAGVLGGFRFRGAAGVLDGFPFLIVVVGHGSSPLAMVPAIRDLIRLSNCDSGKSGASWKNETYEPLAKLQSRREFQECSALINRHGAEMAYGFELELRRVGPRSARSGANCFSQAGRGCRALRQHERGNALSR
jgi:hypothetical protein